MNVVVVTKPKWGLCADITRDWGRNDWRYFEDMGFHTFPKNSQWQRRRKILRQTVPQPRTGDRKSLIADGWKTGASGDKRWWRGMQSGDADGPWRCKTAGEIRQRDTEV